MKIEIVIVSGILLVLSLYAGAKLLKFHLSGLLAGIVYIVVYAFLEQYLWLPGSFNRLNTITDAEEAMMRYNIYITDDYNTTYAMAVSLTAVILTIALCIYY